MKHESILQHLDTLPRMRQDTIKLEQGKKIAEKVVPAKVEFMYDEKGRKYPVSKATLGEKPFKPYRARSMPRVE